MKLLVAAFLAISIATGASAQSSQTQPRPASFPEGDGMLHKPSPSPAPGASKGAAAPKEKKPLTASLGKDNSGKQDATTFASGDPAIYCAWKAETGTKGEKVRIAWYSDGAKGRKLTENVQTIPGTGSVSGSAHIEKPAGGFPPGKYRADVFDDGKLARSLKFTITK